MDCTQLRNDGLYAYRELLSGTCKAMNTMAIVLMVDAMYVYLFFSRSSPHFMPRFSRASVLHRSVVDLSRHPHSPYPAIWYHFNLTSTLSPFQKALYYKARLTHTRDDLWKSRWSSLWGCNRWVIYILLHLDDSITWTQVVSVHDICLAFAVKSHSIETFST